MEVLDEPTAFLDATAAAQVRAVIQERAQQRLMLISSHDPELLALADQVIVVEPTLHRLQQRFQHKRPEVQPGVGQHQPRMLQPELTPEQQIQIEGTWPPALFTGSITAESLFQPQCRACGCSSIQQRGAGQMQGSRPPPGRRQGRTFSPSTNNTRIAS